MDKNNLILSIKNVNKRYKLNKTQFYQALFDINIDFHAGELVSIVGESGSGKSTLMNLIGGLDSDFSGKIIVDNQNLRELSDKQLDKYRKDRVGFVFQSFNLISHLSILDNVTLALTLSNVSEKEKLERATKLLKSVGLERQLKKKPTQLSGGQKQRVAIARALINNPDIIIADEPTGALDSSTSMQILKILKEIADSGKLVIMVTHSEKVAAISSRVIEISDGRITSDKVNENYIRDENIIEENKNDAESKNELSPNEESDEDFDNVNEALDKNLIAKEIKNKNKKNVKQNLSVWSAIRLSFHNMWASKTKNFLMAFGVAIGIGSLILMLCFNSGISDYINGTMLSYSDPTIVTISKKSESGLKSYETFSNDEISNLTDEINSYLQEEGYNFEVKNDEDENIYYGFEALTLNLGGISATVGYDFTADSVVDYETMDIYYLYTTPPYYSDNIITGEKSTSESGIMFTPAISKLFGDIDPIGKTVQIKIQITNEDGTSAELVFYEKITGLVNTSFLSSYPMLFIDYDLLAYHYYRLTNDNDPATPENILQPNILYIQTTSEDVASAINSFISNEHSDDLTGSIEDSLAGILSEVGSTIGLSLTIISLVAIIVSAIMILVVMYMSVTERTKEIGVLKSIGARKSDIRLIFTSESFLVGLLSGILGLVCAGIFILLAYIVLISIVGISPLSFKWYYIFIAFGVSIIISILSGLYPATRAARLDPVEALRRE